MNQGSDMRFSLKHSKNIPNICTHQHVPEKISPDAILKPMIFLLQETIFSWGT